MTGSSGPWQQQAFALDARVNANRAINHPNFRTQYIRRRSQLLREHDSTGCESERQGYLKLRSQLLKLKYGISFDLNSSRSMSAISSRISESPDRRRSLDGSFYDSEYSNKNMSTNLIEENYAFGTILHMFDQHSAPVIMIKFANNNRSLLCCASLDNTLSICDVSNFPPKVNILKGHTAGVTACDWSISNDLIASSSLDGTVRLWSVKENDIKSIREIKDQIKDSEILSCLFHPVNCNLIVIGNSKGLVEVLNISIGIYPRNGSSKIGGRVEALAFDTSGNLFWAGNDKGTITSFILKDANGRISKCKRLNLGENYPITSLSWRQWCNRETRDPYLLVNCAANVLYLFGVCDNSEGKLILKRRFPIVHKNKNLKIKSTFCPIMSFRQGVCIVTGSEDCCVYFYDISSNDKNACFHNLHGHSSPVLDVSFNYDESLLATTDDSGLIILWSRDSKSKNSSITNNM